MIEQALLKYTTAVEAAIEQRRREPTRKGGLVEWLNKDDQLHALVKQLEEGREFSALLEATRSAFRSDDWHSAKSASWWTDPVRNFFRRTSFYTDTFFKDSGRPCDLVKRYEQAFQRRSVQTTYLAPIEFVKFPKTELKFSGFEIRRFKREEFDKIVGNDANRIFYPHAVVDTDFLQEYWFIAVEAEKKVRRLGYLYYSAADVAAAEGRVSPKYTGFPPEIERVLARLVLFDWVGDPTDPLSYGGLNGDPFGFKIPFVLRVDDNDLARPSVAPECSKLETTPWGDDGEYEIPIVLFNLNEPRVAAFEYCIQRADECLGHLRLETDDTHWPFLKVAIDNLIKAFSTEELEQLLWHITALEALLGKRGPGLTASLARRSAAILGGTENERKVWKKKFNDLYDLRSALVHGRQLKEDIHRKQLFEARMMVLRVTIRFVHYLGETAAKINEGSWKSKAPTREDFLTLLDRSEADRDRLSALLSNLPTGFPAAPDWSP